MAEEKSDDKMVVENEAAETKDDKKDKDAGKSKKAAQTADPSDLMGEPELVRTLLPFSLSYFDWLAHIHTLHFSLRPTGNSRSHSSSW